MYENWKDADGTAADVEVTSSRYGTQYSVVFTYSVDGDYYGGTFTTSEEYRRGDPVPVLYDPANPERNNLVEQEKRRHWIVGAVVVGAALAFLYLVTR